MITKREPMKKIIDLLPSEQSFLSEISLHEKNTTTSVTKNINMDGGRAYETKKRLLRRGLITQETSGREKILFLTKKGERISERLLEIRAILDNKVTNL